MTVNTNIMNANTSTDSYCAVCHFLSHSYKMGEEGRGGWASEVEVMSI